MLLVVSPTRILKAQPNTISQYCYESPSLGEMYIGLQNKARARPGFFGPGSGRATHRFRCMFPHFSPRRSGNRRSPANTHTRQMDAKTVTRKVTWAGQLGVLFRSLVPVASFCVVFVFGF